MDLNEKIGATGRIELQGGIRLQCDFNILQYFDGSLEIECSCADPLAGLHLLSNGNQDTGKVIGRKLSTPMRQ